MYDDSIGLVKTAKKTLYNRRDGIEMKREKLEAQLMEGNVGGEAFKRINAKLDTELLAIQKELTEQDKVRMIDISVIDEVLSLTQDIVKTYDKADTDHKRAYLHFFFQKIWVQNKKIMEVEYTPALQVLNEAKLGILSADWLPLKDLFCNHKLEFDLSLEDLKIFTSLLSQQDNFKQDFIHLNKTAS